MSDAYDLGYELGKHAQQGGLNSALSLQATPAPQLAPPGAPQAPLPGAQPSPPLMAGMAQPAPAAPPAPGAGNRAPPVTGVSPMQQPQQNRSSGLVRQAADYQVPGAVGSFSTAVPTPEGTGQRTDADRDTGQLSITPKPRRPKFRRRGGSLLSRMIGRPE